jgi:hypothetical protein
VTIDSDTLPAEEAAQLEKLVVAANLPELVAEAPRRAAKARPDAFHYRVVVEDGGQNYTIDAADPDLPASLRPLIDWAMKRPM